MNAEIDKGVRISQKDVIAHFRREKNASTIKRDLKELRDGGRTIPIIAYGQPFLGATESLTGLLPGLECGTRSFMAMPNGMVRSMKTSGRKW